jgi:hypothetical protein
MTNHFACVIGEFESRLHRTIEAALHADRPMEAGNLGRVACFFTPPDKSETTLLAFCGES